MFFTPGYCNPNCCSSFFSPIVVAQHASVVQSPWEPTSFYVVLSVTFLVSEFSTNRTCSTRLFTSSDCSLNHQRRTCSQHIFFSGYISILWSYIFWISFPCTVVNSLVRSIWHYNSLPLLHFFLFFLFAQPLTESSSVCSILLFSLLFSLYLVLFVLFR